MSTQHLASVKSPLDTLASGKKQLARAASTRVTRKKAERKKTRRPR